MSIISRLRAPLSAYTSLYTRPYTTQRHMASLATIDKTDWKPAVDIEPRFEVFTRPVNQSVQDDRSYRLIKLENGLQALLISDPASDKAAASLNVGVGHLSDPDDRPGLAHFCEHLLFMVRPPVSSFLYWFGSSQVPPGYPGHETISQGKCVF